MIYHTIISSAGKYGTISPYGATTVINEDNQTYVITPDRGYRIASVMIDGTYLTGTALERVQNSKTYTFYDVTQLSLIHILLRQSELHFLCAVFCYPFFEKSDKKSKN